jgi:GAF domain-containing protein
MRVAGRPRGGAFAHGLAELADELSSVKRMSELREASRRAAGLLRADDVALMRVDRAAGTLVLLTDHADYMRDHSWALADFPATEHVLAHRIPGQVVAGDAASDPAELAALTAAGFEAMLMLPVICGGRELAVLEVYRALPQAFTGAEVDRARVVAQQFGAALDRLTA